MSILGGIVYSIYSIVYMYVVVLYLPLVSWRDHIDEEQLVFMCVCTAHGAQFDVCGGTCLCDVCVVCVSSPPCVCNRSESVRPQQTASPPALIWLTYERTSRICRVGRV